MNTIAVNNKINKLKWSLIIALSIIGAAGANSAMAGDWEESMERMTEFSTAIQTMITGFATVAVAPVGMAAAVKCFRHIALANM